MNEVIMGLYEIEEEAGKIMEHAHSRRQELLEKNKKQMEEADAQMEGELEGRLSILKSQLEEQTAEEIAELVEQNQKQVEQINTSYQKDLHKFAQEIVKKITEV